MQRWLLCRARPLLFSAIIHYYFQLKICYLLAWYVLLYIYTIQQLLTWCQLAFLKFPAFDVTESLVTKVCAVKFDDGVAKGGEGAADLAVAAFAHLNDPAVVVAVVLALKRQATGPVR